MDGASTLGQRIRDAIQRAVELAVQSQRSLPIPGEGTERPFRAWLKSNLLVPILGWPDDRVQIGELFDILLRDAQDFEVATIETKAPFHRATEQERADFLRRLPNLPRLRVAYFTNGPEWDRLDLAAPAGVQDILDRTSLDIRQATSDQVEAFFTPLRGDLRFSAVVQNRSLVTREHRPVLEQLAHDLDRIVREVGAVLESTFGRYDNGDAGTEIQRLTRALFDDWCVRSMQAPPYLVVAALANLVRAGTAGREVVRRALREQGFARDSVEATADHFLALAPNEREDPEMLRRALEEAYQPVVQTLSAQSAHLLLGRVLTYRIGEDVGLFDHRMRGEALEATLAPPIGSAVADPAPALTLVDTTLRRLMVDVLPIVYQLGDLDWWSVPYEKRGTLSSRAISVVRDRERELDVALTEMLRRLNGYDFAEVDADVWQNVYQRYLPPEERQRLGGFYTPEPLVDLVLDLVGYVPAAEGLCARSVLDPACGSGAFVNLAAARLLEHLSRPMACHEDILRPKVNTPDWTREQAVIQIVVGNIHAVDVHPFAAFLTTLNLTFLLLPTFVSVRRRNPEFTLDIQVFSANSLETAEEQAPTRDMFEQLNSRLQLAAESFARYGRMSGKKFDVFVGNPPWGGILKGSLAPVYDDRQKQRFRRRYPHAARGKYDVYGLFLELAHQTLCEGGQLGLVTQDTYFDREWARPLRDLISAQMEVQYIVDLNPYGQLMFQAMNTPAIIIASKKVPARGSFIGITARKARLDEPSQGDRQLKVVRTVRCAISALAGSRVEASVAFCDAVRQSRATLRETVDSGWSLRATQPMLALRPEWFRTTDILQHRQGVTPGGYLSVFLMTTEEAGAHGIERELMRPAIKTIDLDRWRVRNQDRSLLFPYLIERDKLVPAFDLGRPNLRDSVDFDVLLDDRERGIWRSSPRAEQAVIELVEHRIAEELVRFPNAARYLVQYYVQLEGRVFEKRAFTASGKRWYEYHRPRTPDVIQMTPRILTPSLIREPTFALDTSGFVSDHAGIFLLPTTATSEGRERLRTILAQELGRHVTIVEVLQYCLAFLNSSIAKDLLTTGRPTPKGSYQITERKLRSIPVVPPSNRRDAEDILQAVSGLCDGSTPADSAMLEEQAVRRVDELVRGRASN